MRKYLILEKGDIIDKDDEFASSFEGIDWKPIPYMSSAIGAAYDPMEHSAIRRYIPDTQWQTGEIPEPTGPSALYKKGDWYPKYIADLNANNYWVWRNSFSFKIEEPQLDQWFIQIATLPAPTVSGEDNQC